MKRLCLPLLLLSCIGSVGAGPDDAAGGFIDAGMVDAGRLTLDAGTPDSGQVVDAGLEPRDASVALTGDALFITVDGTGNTPWVAISCDGKGWDGGLIPSPAGQPTDGEGGGLRGVGYGNGTFIVTGGGSLTVGGTRLIGRSRDAIHWAWEDQSALCAANANACNADGLCTTCDWIGGAGFIDDGTPNGVFVAGGGNGVRLWSTDLGKTWSQSANRSAGAHRRFINGGHRAVGAGANILTVIEVADAGSPEPLKWTDSAGPGNEAVTVAYGNGAFVAVWYNDGCVVLSPGASEWRPCVLPVDKDVLTTVVFGDGHFSIFGRGTPLVSDDGVVFTTLPNGHGTDFRDMKYGLGVYATPSLWSDDALTFHNASPPPPHGYAMGFGQLASGRCPQ